MRKQIMISNFTQIKRIVSAAALCDGSIGIHDRKGSKANAKSILGLMSLDYSHPVDLVCDTDSDLHRILNSVQ